MYFVWQPYSKQIIPYQIDKTNVSDVITNIIYFSICFFVMIFLANNFFVSENLNKIRFKKALVLIGIMFGVQLVSDIIKITIFYFVPTCIFIFSDVLSVVCFAFNLTLLINMCKPTVSDNKKRMYFSLILLVIAVLILIIYEVKNFGDINYANYISAKYDYNSSIYLTMFNNYKYSHEARTLFVETVCSCLTLLGAIIGCSVEPDKDEVDKHCDNRPSMQIVRLVARILLIGICFIFLLVVKTLILPKSAIGTINSTQTTSFYHQEDGMLYSNGDFTNIHRKINYSSEEPVYKILNIGFGVNNTTIYNIVDNDLLNTDAPNEIYTLNEYNFDGTIFSVYGNKLLILHRDEHYEFIKFEDISKMEYDQDIINGLKSMILDGAYTYFEYGYEYLLKYDPEFINYYIEQYSNGIFYENETQNPYNFGINEEYIQSIAQKIK